MSGAVLAWLVTWTWQAVALTVVSTVVLRLATRANASTRYLAWWITLAGVLVLAVMPWSWPLVPENTSAGVGAPPGDLLLTSPDSDRFGLVEIPSVPFWIIGVGAALWTAYSGRRLTALARSMAHLRIVKRGCAPVPPPLEQRLRLWMSVRHKGRSARLCVSEDVATACMLGLGTPIIALPQVLVAALTDADLDRIVLHEYGHVQRRDDWATLAQASIEALLGWHPAVWWIGRSLCLEREVACDDWVILRTAAPRDYASSLTKVAVLALKPPARPFASRAWRSRRELMSRVERLLNPMRNVAVRPIRSVLATGTIALGSVVVLLGQTPPVVTVGIAEPLPTVPAFRFYAPPLMLQVASHRLVQGDADTGGARAQMTTTQADRPSPPLKSEYQTTLLEHAKLSALRGLAPPNSLKPALAHRRPRPILRSSELALDTGFAVPMNVSVRKPRDLRSQHMATETAQSPWEHIAYAGRAVGVGASYAGVATGVAFRTVGSSVARVFVGSH